MFPSYFVFYSKENIPVVSKMYHVANIPIHIPIHIKAGFNKI